VGQVGSALLRQLDRRREEIADIVGEPLYVRHGVVRHPHRARPCPDPRLGYTTDAEAAALDPAVDVVVEVAGGRFWAPLLERVVDGGRPVVTANKELVAWHGPALRRRARAAGTDVWMEASVGGAIPVLRTLELSWPGYRFDYVAGVLNGTVNFVLDAMGEGRSQAEAVAAAQAGGMAETDPSADLSGLDTQRKLGVLMQLAFGVSVAPSSIPTRGIEALDGETVRAWRRRGYRVKLLAQAWNGPEGVSAVVGPAVVPALHPLGQLKGAENAVLVSGPDTGEAVLMGLGAGGDPTASAVLADVVAAARLRRGRASLSWSRPVRESVAVADRPLDVVIGVGMASDPERVSPAEFERWRQERRPRGEPLWWWGAHGSSARRA
jgi:homoserine dehydrogenase